MLYMYHKSNLIYFLLNRYAIDEMYKWGLDHDYPTIHTYANLKNLSHACLILYGDIDICHFDDIFDEQNDLRFWLGLESILWKIV